MVDATPVSPMGHWRWWVRGGGGEGGKGLSHHIRNGRSSLTSIVAAAECPDPALSLLSWWPRSGLTQHYHFYRGGRGVVDPAVNYAQSNILTSIVAAAERLI